jgi:hypothetical protein
VTTLVGINVVDTWKLSIQHTLFSRLQIKHNAEQTITIKVFAWILTKQLLKKADNVMTSMTSSSLEIIDIHNKNDQEDVSELSNNFLASLTTKTKKTCICYYPTVTIAKGKTHKKSRRCVKCNHLTVDCCGCCDKVFCHAVGERKHDRTCLIDYLKEMGKPSRKRSRNL